MYMYNHPNMTACGGCHHGVVTRCRTLASYIIGVAETQENFEDHSLFRDAAGGCGGRRSVNACHC